MQTVRATFEDGVFKPKEAPDLPSPSEVRITIEPLSVSTLTVSHLNEFLSTLPSLGDDAEDFARDVMSIRAEFPAEGSPWD